LEFVRYYAVGLHLFPQLSKGSGHAGYSTLSDNEDGAEVPDLEEISINIC
jgi:hypothetical protein